MDPDLFNVIFTGKLVDGFELQTVTEAFAEKFKLPLAKAGKVVNAQKELVLKPNLEHVKAYKLKLTLEAMGLEIRLERAVVVEASTAVNTDSPNESTEPSTEAVEELVSETVVESNIETQSSDKAENNSASWSLEPLSKEESETTNDEVAEKPTERVLFTTKVEHVYQPKIKTEDATEVKEAESNETDRPVASLIKNFGTSVRGKLAAVLLKLKKKG